jgi:ribosomal protein S21
MMGQCRFEDMLRRFKRRVQSEVLRELKFRRKCVTSSDRRRAKAREAEARRRRQKKRSGQLTRRV